MFSARVPALRSNRVARVLAALRASGAPIDDLTSSNPTTAGLTYPPDLLDPLSDAAGLHHDPAPFGLPAARAAVAAHLTARGVTVPSERVVLTASTSEAYSLLFKLLCDPGDVVLVPRPGYPLFEHLTRLDGLRSGPYLLEYHGRWCLDLDSLERALDPRARAVLLVNPNNPTGSYVPADDLRAVRAIAARHELAIISDEVFDTYPLDPGGGAQTTGALTGDADVLTFTLGGLSKTALLPQLKLGWIVVGGPEPLVLRALERLELICDSYLSVAAPVQLAAGALLARPRPLAEQLRGRLRANHAALGELLRRYPSCQVLHMEAGWYAVLQVPATRSEEALVIELLEKDRILVHPGYFFDFPREAFLVVSLLPEPARFERAMSRVLARAAR